MTGKAKGTDVLIDGRIYNLTGEDPEYIQKISGYLNMKMAEVKTSAGYRNLDSDYRALLLNLNIADDYFKMKDEAAALQKKCEELEKELYAARHDVASARVKLENTLKNQRY